MLTEEELALAGPLIKRFEGCRLRSYRDSGGAWTIGYGHTKNVDKGMSINQIEANTLFINDLDEAKNRVLAVLTDQIYHQLDEFKIAALISQAYNLRSFEKLAGYLSISEDLYKRKLLLYCADSAGNYLNGLKIRRISERLLFEHKDWEPIADELQFINNFDYSKKKEKWLFKQ